MQIHQPVMNGKFNATKLLTSIVSLVYLPLRLDVAEQHMKAGILVYLVRPIEQFTNQIILKAEQPTVFSVNKTLPPALVSCSIQRRTYLTPKKFDAMHRFMRIFHTYHNPFIFFLLCLLLPLLPFPQRHFLLLPSLLQPQALQCITRDPRPERLDSGQGIITKKQGS